MINALTVSMGFHRQDGQTPYEQNDSDSETSLCESVKLEEVPSEALAVIQGEGDQADRKSDEMETVPDGDSCSTTSTQSGEFIAITRPTQRRSNYMMRTNTESFMNYVQSRRSSKMTMNGGYGFNHSKYVGDSFSISEGPDDQSEETIKQKLRNFSFAQFVSSGKSFDDFKRDQQMDQETSSHSSARMSLLKHMDRKSSSKFEISSQIAEGAGSDESSVASNFSFYGNKNAKLSITATACTPANKRKSQYCRKSMRKEPIGVDPSILNSSYLLKIESSTQDDASLASSTSSSRLQQPISSSGNKQDFQKNLADTMKYGIGKRTDTVVLDAQLFAERLNKVKIGHTTTSPHHDSDGNMSSDQSSASFVSKKNGLVFSDEDSFQTSNTNIAVKTFSHSSHIEPSQGKSFHDPLNSQLVEAFLAAHELKESSLKEAFERNGGKSGNNSHSNSPVKYDEVVGIGTTSTVEQQPMRNRFLSLIEGGDSTTKPISTDLAMAYSNSAWDVHRAMQGVKMDSHKKMKLLETMQQVTVASLIENSTCSSDKSLLKVQSVKKNSVCSNSSQNSPINASKATSVQPPIINESDQQPVLSTLTLTLDDEVSVDEKTEVDLFKERHQADNVNNRGDNSPLVGDEIKVPSVGALSYHRDSDPILVEPPRIAYSDSFDDSPIQQRGISRRSILSTHSRSTTARSDDESWAESIPDLLSHPAHASPPSSKAKAKECAKSYGRTPKDSAVSLNMDSIHEEGKLYHQENRNQWGSRGLKSPNGSSRPHQNSLAGCQSLPELVIKPMVELPRVKTSKSKLTVTPKSPLNESLTVAGIDTSKPSRDISSPPPRTNSPSAIRRLQRPTSPVVVEEVKSMLHIQGSLASSGPYLPQHGDFTESNSRFFLQVPSSASWGDLNSMNRSTMTLTKAASHKKVPWLPRGTLTPLDHDRSDLIEGWREKIELLRYQPFDASKIPMTIKSQAAAKQAFEQYARSLSHPAKIK
jgi:hypothetical protein